MVSRVFGILLLLGGFLLLAQADKENKIHHRRKGLSHPLHLKPALHHKKYLDDIYDEDGSKKHLAPAIKKKWINKKLNPRHYEEAKIQHHLDSHKRDPWDEAHYQEGMHLQSLDHPRALPLLPLQKLAVSDHAKQHSAHPASKETSHEPQKIRKAKGHPSKKESKGHKKTDLPTGLHLNTVPKKYHEKDYYLKKHVKKSGKKVNKKHHFAW